MSLSEQIWYPEQFEYAKLNSDVHFFCFRPELLFLDKYGQKKLKLPV